VNENRGTYDCSRFGIMGIMGEPSGIRYFCSLDNSKGGGSREISVAQAQRAFLGISDSRCRASFGYLDDVQWDLIAQNPDATPGR
jgi:hypothetical protein